MTYPRRSDQLCPQKLNWAAVTTVQVGTISIGTKSKRSVHRRKHDDLNCCAQATATEVAKCTTIWDRDMMA